jgi:hypothetical protein
VLSFWLAYILTRPLGASIGDFMAQSSHKYGGLGLGTTKTSYIFLGCILILVSYLSITERDQTPPDVIVADEARRQVHGREHHAHLPHVGPPLEAAGEEA